MTGAIDWRDKVNLSKGTNSQGNLLDNVKYYVKNEI